MVIEVKGLTKKFGKQTVVQDINFSVDSGDVFALLGKNGAGKSTTLHMMTSIVRPTCGSVSFYNQKYRFEQVRKHIGVLPDSSNYYSDLTAFQHLRFFSSLKGLSRSKCDLFEVLRQVGLESAAKKKVGSFSLGMKKKLSMAQALIGNPDILFLDEPTSTLDPESALVTRNLIVSLAKKGKTIVMTSHNLEEVEKICDVIAIMDKGKILKYGTLSELRKDAQKGVRVSIRSTQHEKDRKEFIEKVSRLGILVDSREDGFSLMIDSDEHIPGLVSLAVNQNIRIYGVEVDKISLEEIYLSD